MKKLLLPLLLSSSFCFAEDIVYYDQASLLSQSSTTKQVAEAINSKLSSQESGILLLADKISAQESQLVSYTDRYSSYAKMPKQAKKSFDTVSDSYSDNLSRLSSQYKSFMKQRRLLNEYAAYKLGSLADGVARDYAKKNGLKAIYDNKQFRYVESSFDITNKLLPDFNKVDTSGVIGVINGLDLSAKSGDDN